MFALRRQPRPPEVRPVSVPAPSGVNVVDTAGQLSADDALALVNMIRRELGLATRPGYREWVTGINSGGEVRSLLSFAGSNSGEDRLFACAQDGVYGCTASTSTPSRVYAFPTTSGTSGFGIARGFTTVAGGHYLLLWDEANGYITYNESGDTWTLVPAGAGAGEINGVNPRSLVFGTSHKHRLWMVERDTANAWILPVDSITGTATRFPWGPQFKHGGTLVGVWSWTIDGGAGIDDFLVGISSTGDVVVYQGTDPTDANQWALRGVWYVGGVAAGRNIVTDNGGDLAILSLLGLIPLSKLLSGAAISDLDAYASRKISPRLGRLLSERTGRGWSMAIHPEERALVVNTPAVAGSPREQWVMSLARSGWTQWTGVPMTCSESWRGKLYFGTANGRVCINDGSVDNAELGGSANAIAIDSWMISAPTDLGIVAWKTLVGARPHFMTEGTAPQYAVSARLDYDKSAPGAVSYVAATGTTGIWGTAIWGSSTWGSGEGVAGEWRGLAGMGSTVALAIRMSTKSRVTLVGFDVQYIPGGAT